MAKYYITNAIPYVNASPHIGHALEFTQSDAIARYRRLKGDNVFLLCGGDENALKNVQAAEKAGKPIQEFIDHNTKLFYELSGALDVRFDAWQKGSDQKHQLSSQKLWELCAKEGDIYKKSYNGLYCVGCEAYYANSDLNKDKECPEHPGRSLEVVGEENYFFRLSKYEKKLKEIISKDQYKIVPAFRKNEILAFLDRGLEDFSISRSNTRAKNWGVPVPQDPSQRIYVWFDALNIYQSGIGFGYDEDKYNRLWPADLHVIGKGIIRFHAIYWPAILMSAKLNLPKKLFVHEYFTVNGQKMSKTLGNIIDPFKLIKKYGADPLRYYCLSRFSPFLDGDFSEKKFIDVYNADLANGLGNLIARVAKLCETADYRQMGSESRNNEHVIQDGEYTRAFEEYKFNEAIGFVRGKIANLDQFINQEKPWALIKSNSQRLQAVLAHCVDQIQEIAILFSPIMPQTSERILSQFKGPKIISQKPLFPRI